MTQPRWYQHPTVVGITGAVVRSGVAMRKSIIVITSSLFVAACAIACTGVAHGDNGRWDGNSWLQSCQGPPSEHNNNFIELSYCAGYVRGFADAINIWQGLPTSVRLCIPSGVTTEQLVDISLNWLRANPKHRHEDMGALLPIILITTFRCDDGRLIEGR
jgi:Rap1a immunity proteins